MTHDEYLRLVEQVIAMLGHRSNKEFIFAFSMATTTLRCGSEAQVVEDCERCRNAIWRGLVIYKEGAPYYDKNTELGYKALELSFTNIK